MAIVETPTGLTGTEVQSRIEAGQVNITDAGPIRSLRQIIYTNVFNPVNATMVSLFILILVARSPRDALFVGVVFSNSIIGIFTELRARKELGRLAVLNAPKARVIRDGSSQEIQVAEVVADDILKLSSGDQAVVDGEVVSGIGLEIDESLLTGESDHIQKDVSDEVLSGSFVTAGSGYIRATRVGADSYANKLGTEARQFKLVNSELRTGINLILKVLMFVIPPTGILLFFVLLNNSDNSWTEALQSGVGAAVAMVPDGLVLLTSLAFLVGVIRLAQHKALSKELATVELLARVDVLCLDKTGTITTGAISFSGIELLENSENSKEGFIYEALGAYAAADPSPNNTMLAVAERYPDSANWSATQIEPFSSARKWSATEFANQGTFYFGAPDVLLTDDKPQQRTALKKITNHSKEGKRVLVFCQSAQPLGDDPQLPDDISPVAIILLEDEIRSDAQEIFGYFQKRNVTLKVISGDNVNTVMVVAERAGIKGAKENAIDARQLPDIENLPIEDLADILEENVVFGRVTPQQKQAMVLALQSRGHTVAMTGDGVNDVLALKNSDMGIAMGSGSAATRSVAELVLLDNRFSTLPTVLTESRKVINNVERVANLFISKAIYAVLITIGVGIATTDFPFLPRHLTLVGTFSIGLPGLVLALAPSAQKVEKGFIWRSLKFSIPAGIITAAGTGIAYGIAKSLYDINLTEERTIATATLLGIGLFILGVTARPFKLWKLGLVIFMACLYGLITVIGFAKRYFEIDLPGQGYLWLITAIIVAVSGALIMLIPLVVKGVFTDPDET